MLHTVALVLATAAILISVFALLAFRQLRGRLRQREEDVAQTLIVLGAQQENAERSVHDLRDCLLQSLTAIEKAQGSLVSLQERFEEVEAYAAVCVPPRPAPSGLNLNRRLEAVRRLREGASEEQVSEELNVALSEVRLIAHLERSKPGSTTKRRRGAA